MIVPRERRAGPFVLRSVEHDERVRREHARGMALRLMETSWSHFATLTTRSPMSDAALARTFQNRFVRQLSRLSGRRVDYFYAIERGADPHAGGHVHALIYGTSLLTTRAIRDEWTHGHTSVAVYDRERDAALYVSKGILLDPDNYDVSRSWPPRRHDSDHAADERLLARLEAQFGR
jgi:hypothetical protein